MRIPNLYLKWHAYKELVDNVSTDKDIGVHLFRHDEGAIPFAKMLCGDLGCAPDIAEALANYMNRRIAALRSRRGAEGGGARPAEAISAADLAAPTLAFVAKLVRLIGDVPDDALHRAHAVLLRDLCLKSPKSESPRLVVEQYELARSFAGVLPSGGSGPVIFEAGKHRGQLAVIGLQQAPLGVYSLFTRDPSPSGLRIWELAWGEAVLWLPSPSVPVLSDGRLMLMPEASPVQPTPGRFNVTVALLWREDAMKSLEPRAGKPPSGALDENDTALFLTRLRRIVDDKRRRWGDAITVLSAEYEVRV